MNRNEKLYFNWLVDLVVSKEESRKFSMVLEKLFNTDFVSYNEFDDNLKENALCLRGKYGRDYDFDTTVLELMVYLATEIEDTLMANNEFGDRTGLWFWFMMESLDLIQYDNSRYNEVEIDKKLDIFIERRYQRDGFGGLFTVEKRNFDARNSSIWTQAQSFLTEFAKNNGELF